MNIIKIILIGIIILFIYRIKNNEHFANIINLVNDDNKKKNKIKINKNKKTDKKLNNIDIELDDLLSEDETQVSNDLLSSFLSSDSNDTTINKNIKKSNIYNIQYNYNFIDVINSIKYIQSNRIIFNKESSPVKYYKISKSEENNLSNIFVSKLNEYIRKKIIIPSNVKSGWEKVQKKLGLPTLYNNEIFKSNINIYKINSSGKYVTKNQTKYVLNITFKKENIKERIVMEINIIENKNKDIIIQNIFIVGYTNLDKYNFETHNALNYDIAKENSSDKFNELTDVTEIQKQLYNKYKKIICHEKRNKLNIDTNGSVYRSDLPYNNDIKC
jgi:hypothetical protein